MPHGILLDLKKSRKIETIENNYISESWIRCLEKGFDHSKIPESKVMSQQNLNHARDENQNVRKFVLPELELLFSQIAGTNFMVAYADQHGTVLDTIYDTEFSENSAKKVKELTKGKGSEAVIDFVGEKGSTAMGIQMTSNGGFYYIVGYGEEIKSLAVDFIISEKTIVGNLVGTWSELYELMELADRGKVKLSMQEYKLDDANKALHDLNEGKVKGRAVLVP